ncbi:hypothetical protein [Micromonospora sp. CPCC 206061]|uniref:hypothetical protein n=1 Tax=Micromonospora sp. CPCC 206061 TaxID=3122410 RepID=UPI002FF430BF
MRFRLGRRSATAALPVAPPPAAADADAGHALRAPSKLHAFNRYEIKYLADHSMVDELRPSAFTKVYDAAYRDLYRKLYASGAALAAIDQVSAGLKAAGTDVGTEAASLRTLVENRTKSLATDKVITG